jgi:hypothetical protein
MNNEPEDSSEGREPRDLADRRVRADAQCSIESLLRAALAVSAEAGV